MEHSKPAGWYEVVPQLHQFWDGSRWVGKPVPEHELRLNQTSARETPGSRQRSLVRRLLILGAMIALGLGVNFTQTKLRSETPLGAEQEGSQQAWLDYFERSGKSVNTFNEMLASEFTVSSFTAALDALREMNDSPDATLNRTIDAAIAACESGDVNGCTDGLDATADEYNRVLTQAAEEGLIEVRD